MKNTGIKVTEVSIETMLNDKVNSSYNPSVWAERIKDYTKYPDIKFYVVPADKHFTYDRFFVSYTIPEGLHILSKFSAYSAGLTNNGFVKAHIIDGEIHKDLFTFDDKSEGVIANNKQGRKFLVDSVCSKGVMVSTCI